VARTPLLATSLLLACAGALADPGYYVVTAYDNEGVRTVDFRYWTVKRPGAPEVVWPEVGLAYGVTSRWTTEILASWVGSSQFATRLSTVNWLNDVLLTQGELPFDLALHTHLIRYQSDEPGGSFEFGPVLQTDIGRTQLNANLFFEREFGTSAVEPTQLKYQWQARYRWKPALHVGLQGFGELGEWNHWAPRDQQSHRAGPVVFGTLPLGDRQALKAQAAYLVGSTYGSHGHMFSLRVHWEF
jgi:hypothetical protein